MITRAWACCALLVLGAACDRGGPTRCALGTEYVVARPLAHSLDAIALAQPEAGPLAVWSEPAGLFARRLQPGGKPVANARRVGPRCERGLAAVGVGSHVLVACNERAEASQPGDEGSIMLLELGPNTGLIASERVATVSSSSWGVALARHGDRTDLAWQDGRHVVHHVRGDAQPPRVLSAPSREAGPPALAWQDGRALITWSERIVEDGHVHTRMFASRGEAARELGRAEHSEPLPQLIGGTRLVALRDQPDREDKAGLFLAPLEPDALGLGARLRVGRADGRTGPALVACLDGVVAAAPRTHGNEEFVSVQWIAKDLQHVRGGQQFFEDGRAFTQAAALCVGQQALVLIGEHTGLDKPRTSVRAVTYACQ